MSPKADVYVDLRRFAELAGVEYHTMRGYHGHASKRRREGVPLPGDVPPPDSHFGQSPVWRRTTVDRWIKSRPGRGAGGGRPRKEAG